jgi:acetamidase/formamidase
LANGEDTQGLESSLTERRIGSIHSHGFWDRSIEPALRVAPGTEVELELLDASGGQVGPKDGPDAIDRLDLARVNPCTGPIAVDGLEPGQGLVATILDVFPAPWSWTANIPGFGLLADDFPDAHLWISKVEDGRVHTPIGIELPARPMIGSLFPQLTVAIWTSARWGRERSSIYRCWCLARSFPPATPTHCRETARYVELEQRQVLR